MIQNTINSSNVGFHRDINGLRAWAALAVVAFHFHVLGMSGGFVGVDVFFVISGYLMTKILYRPNTSHPIDFLKFYTSRLKRVFPALFVMLVFCVIVGSVILMPFDYVNLLKEVRDASYFYTNIRNKNFDYFAADDVKWLIHTWTLGVEFQFYLLYAVFMGVMLKLSRRLIIHLSILGLLSVVSFVAMLYMTFNENSKAFFLLPYRMWEFLIGGLIYIVSYENVIKSSISKLCKCAVNVSGWLLLIFALFWLNETWIWPSYTTLLPVIATAMIIATDQNTYFSRHPIVQKLGEASYSIYLWHWPIYVFVTILGLSTNLYKQLLLPLFVLSILVGCLSYYYIEQPAARWLIGLSDDKQRLKRLLAAMIGLLIVVITLQKQKILLPLPEDHTADINRIMSNKRLFLDSVYHCVNTDDDRCFFGDTARVQAKQIDVIVVGDSHAASLLTGIDTLAKQHHWTVKGVIASSCPAIIGLKTSAPQDINDARCIRRLATLTSLLSQYPKAKVCSGQD